MLSFKRKLTKNTIQNWHDKIGDMGWGGLCPFEKYLVLIYVTSIEIKIEVKASWLLYILYSPPIFKNKRCYVHAKHYKLRTIL